MLLCFHVNVNYFIGKEGYYMDQDFFNKTKEKQKTKQTPVQTENKEDIAPQSVSIDEVEEKKDVQEGEKEVSSQSEQYQQTAEHQQANHTYHSPYQAQPPYGNGQSWQGQRNYHQQQNQQWQGQYPPYQPPYSQQPYQGNRQQPFYPYGEPQYPMYQQPNTGSNGLAIASLVLGIISLILVIAFSWMLWGSIAGLCLGIVGTILGVMGRKNATGRTMATAGMILSIIGIAIGAICFIACFTYYIFYTSYYYWY